MKFVFLKLPGSTSNWRTISQESVVELNLANPIFPRGAHSPFLAVVSKVSHPGCVSLSHPLWWPPAAPAVLQCRTKTLIWNEEVKEAPEGSAFHCHQYQNILKIQCRQSAACQGRGTFPARITECHRQRLRSGSPLISRQQFSLSAQ